MRLDIKYTQFLSGLVRQGTTFLKNKKTTATIMAALSVLFAYSDRYGQKEHNVRVPACMRS